MKGREAQQREEHQGQEKHVEMLKGEGTDGEMFHGSLYTSSSVLFASGGQTCQLAALFKVLSLCMLLVHNEQ